MASVTCDVGSAGGATTAQEQYELVCHNGGTCPKSFIDPETVMACECSTAIINETQYVGVSCEMAVHFDDYCRGGNESHFCVNGQRCWTSMSGQPACQCSDAYTGPHCQYAVSNATHVLVPGGNDAASHVDSSVPATNLTRHPPSTPSDDEHINAIDENDSPDPTSSMPRKCTLDCQHGSSCRFAPDDATTTTAAWWGTIDDMYCDCSRHWAGTHCQYAAQTCDHGVVCLHGRQCAVAKTTGRPYCAGRPGMQYCNPDPSAHVIYSDSMAVPAYCLNGGMCKDVVDETTRRVTFGCDCPYLYKGRFCELYKTMEELAAAAGPRHHQRGMNDPWNFTSTILGTSMLAVLLVFVLRQFHRVYQRRQRPRPVVLNVRSFQDDNRGAFSVNGSMLFPAAPSTSFAVVRRQQRPKKSGWLFFRRRADTMVNLQSNRDERQEDLDHCSGHERRMPQQHAASAGGAAFPTFQGSIFDDVEFS